MNTTYFVLFICVFLAASTQVWSQGLARYAAEVAPPDAQNTTKSSQLHALPPKAIPYVCYTKSTKCCYKYSYCGVVVRRRVLISKPCPFKRCAKACSRVCRNVQVRVPKRICGRRRVRVARGKHCGKWNFALGKVNVCTPKFTFKRRCYMKKVRAKLSARLALDTESSRERNSARNSHAKKKSPPEISEDLTSCSGNDCRSNIPSSSATCPAKNRNIKY